MCFFFFFNDTATTEIYTLSLHDALPICTSTATSQASRWWAGWRARARSSTRSEEHTSELQSRPHLVCRLLLEKKKNEEGWTCSEANTILGPYSARRVSFRHTHAHIRHSS